MLINAQPAYKEQILSANGGNAVAMDKEWAVVGNPGLNQIHIYKLDYSKMHNTTMDMWLPYVTIQKTGTGK